MSSSPEDMRHAMTSYIAAVNQAYADAAALLPMADRVRLPLFAAGEFTVAAIGTRSLHVLATTEAFPAPTAAEVFVPGATDGLRWQVRFFDPTIIPALGLLDETSGPNLGEVRDVLGIRTHLFHLAIPPGGGLDPHHAQHAGTGLAHSHAAAERDFDNLRNLNPQHETNLREMHGAHVAGLAKAHALLALQITDDAEVRALADQPEPDFTDVRKALLAASRAAR